MTKKDLNRISDTFGYMAVSNGYEWCYSGNPLDDVAAIMCDGVPVIEACEAVEEIYGDESDYLAHNIFASIAICAEKELEKREKEENA